MARVKASSKVGRRNKYKDLLKYFEATGEVRKYNKGSKGLQSDKVFKCRSCGTTFAGSTFRMRHHLLQTHKDVRPCPCPPQEALDYIKEVEKLDELVEVEKLDELVEVGPSEEGSVPAEAEGQQTLQENQDAAGEVGASGVLNAGETERTYIMIKPDGVQRGLIANIIERFERKGYKLVGIKMVHPTKAFAEKHYDDLRGRPFFNDLTDFLSSGPVVAMVWEGPGVIAYGRKLIGATNPQASEPGTIRGDLAVSVGRNIVHGSDGPETAKKEISLWFKPYELMSYPLDSHKWVYEK